MASPEGLMAPVNARDFSAGVMMMADPIPSDLSESPQPASQPGQLIEFRPVKIDAMSLTPDSFTRLTDGHAQKQALMDLERRSYDPARRAQIQNLFPGGELQFRWSPEEARVFDAMQHVMDSESGLRPEDREALALLNGVNVEDAVIAIKDAGKKRKEGGLITDEGEIGGYKLQRQALYEIQEQVKMDLETDEFRRYAFEDLKDELASNGLHMNPNDQRTLDELTAERDEKERFLQAQNDKARIAGYNRVH